MGQTEKEWEDDRKKVVIPLDEMLNDEELDQASGGYSSVTAIPGGNANYFQSPNAKSGH